MGLLDSVEKSIASSLGRKVGGSILKSVINMIHPGATPAAPHATPKKSSQPAEESSGGGLGGLGGLGKIAGGIGGLAGLIKLLQSKGLDDIVKSWISTGPNKPISTQQLTDALGDDHVRDIANQMGTSPDEALNHLKDVLPVVVDHATPNGQVPDEMELLKHLGLG